MAKQTVLLTAGGCGLLSLSDWNEESMSAAALPGAGPG